MSFFDRVAQRYDRSFAPDAAATAADLRSAIAGLSGVVLDLGCGTGRAFPVLVAQGLTVLGLDASDAMLAEARRRASSASVALIRADLYRRWPLRDRSVDAIVALHSVLAHPPGDPRSAWRDVGREMARVARDGATVIVDLPEPTWARAHLAHVRDDVFLFDDGRGATIEAVIPEPSEVVAALGLPLAIERGPLGARARGQISVIQAVMM